MNLCATVDSDAVDADVDLVARQHHAKEAGGPADQPGRRHGLAVGGGDDLLGGGGEPHAVHDRRFQAGKQRGGAVGVDRVVVTGDHRERAHITGRGDGDVATTTARRIGRVVGHRAAGARRVGELERPGAAADREPLLELGQLDAVGVGDGDLNRHHAADLGVGGRRSRCGDGQFGLRPSAARSSRCAAWSRWTRLSRPSTTGKPSSVTAEPIDGEHRGPAEADQRVGHHA